MRTFLTGLVIAGMFADPVCQAAQRDVGPRTCSQQRDTCIAYRSSKGVFGSEGLCTTVFRTCMKTGVWDSRTVFPDGALIRGMIRDTPPKKVAVHAPPQQTYEPGRHCEAGPGGMLTCMPNR